MKSLWLMALVCGSPGFLAAQGRSRPPATPVDFQAYAYRDKDRLVAAAQTELEDMNARADFLAQNVEGSGEAGMARVEEGLRDLKLRREAAAQAFEALRASGENDWDGTKRFLREALEDYREAFEPLNGEF